MNVSRALTAIIFIALLAGCGGAQDALSVAQISHSTSWMLPEAKSQDLLYVTGTAAGEVYVYTYPQRQSVGTLSGLERPGGECVDSAGDVFIAARNSKTGVIYEYAHGAPTPMATLTDRGRPSGCAVDPVTGDLAVANYGKGPGLGGGHRDQCKDTTKWRHGFRRAVSLAPSITRNDSAAAASRFTPMLGDPRRYMTAARTLMTSILAATMLNPDSTSRPPISTHMSSFASTSTAGRFTLSR